MPASVTIASGTSLSAAFSLGGASIGAIIMPAAWSAANLTLQVSYDGTTFYNVYDDQGNELVITASTSRVLLIDNLAQLLALGEGVSYKLRSGTSGTPVNQAADRAIGVVSVL